jgi:threonine dehydratase
VDDRQIFEEVESAEDRVRPYIRETPLEVSPYLSEATGADVFLKLENQQASGSFKLRGAINKLLSLSEHERARPVVTASSGNHAAAIAYALRELGGEGIIYLPETVSQAKVESLKPYGVELRFVGNDSVVGELEAKRVADEQDLTFVSPYNDPKIIGGQGTVAVELTRQLEAFDAVFVPVGGGGLVSGIAGYLEKRRPSARIVGCQPGASAVMFESVRAGRILELDSKPTLADGTAGGIEPGAITFPICQRLIDDFVLTSEEEIAGAMRLVIEKQCMLVEGAAALSLAALMKRRNEFRGKRVVLIFSGKKLSVETLKRVLS